MGWDFVDVLVHISDIYAVHAHVLSLALLVFQSVSWGPNRGISP